MNEISLFAALQHYKKAKLGPHGPFLHLTLTLYTKSVKFIIQKREQKNIHIVRTKVPSIVTTKNNTR